ncbi:tRNA-uridine aminocarboxypropyltransferase 1 [Polistes fuscatus]|uniref:tRNA-uridine aminocarboxypropyltransferase 1 n=1 Tax=Polistes fuscatus TaxID=30207 RepID=UPI001CA96CA7|nr:tRNA-uridine aminocarboxypropyltransferase 1 [Polistes fuscatus]XP_043504440.1 tRNA-uridine aminocarboxypropyltransferase 1 [Polistes fuscatus]
MAEGNNIVLEDDKKYYLEENQRIIDRAPFRNLKIDNAQILDTVEGRKICENCYRSRKFFCYTCFTPMIDEKYFPRLKLPVKIDIIKHRREIEGKSTAVHAAVLAPEDVKIYIYPDFPEMVKNEETVLIFPSKTAVSIGSLLVKEVKQDGKSFLERIGRNEYPIKRAIFIDSTWHQTKSIYKDQRLRDLRCIILKSRMSQFWRHQKKSPRWYLATIEAIHQFLVELHTCAFDIVECTYREENKDNFKIGELNTSNVSNSNQKYDGRYDNLLYFFKYMYEKIHTIYDHEKLLAYKRPLI